MNRASIILEEQKDKFWKKFKIDTIKKTNSALKQKPVVSTTFKTSMCKEHHLNRFFNYKLKSDTLENGKT